MGERLEEIESYLEVVFSRSGAAGRGVGGGAELGAAAVLRRGREGEVWPQSFTAARRTRSGVQLGPRKGGAGARR